MPEAKNVSVLVAISLPKHQPPKFDKLACYSRFFSTNKETCDFSAGLCG